jgi:hypothetical protein
MSARINKIKRRDQFSPRLIGNSVRVETVIPTDKQQAGLLRTRHPELDSGSISTANDHRGCHCEEFDDVAISE